MKQRKITDEMVERAISAGPKRYRIYARGDDPGVKAAFRNALNAALNPAPPDTEIVVTDEMHKAGAEAWAAWVNSGRNMVYSNERNGCIGLVYRAMRKLEPKPERRMGSENRSVSPSGAPIYRPCGDLGWWRPDRRIESWGRRKDNK